MERLIHLHVPAPFVLYVRFDDGVEGEVDLSTRLNGPMFQPLRDPGYFARVVLSDYGAPLWPNGLDLAPDALHQRLVEARAAAQRAEIGTEVTQGTLCRIIVGIFSRPPAIRLRASKADIAAMARSVAAGLWVSGYQ